MALFQCNFYSKSLGYDTQVNVILPENRGDYSFDESRNYCFQVLYLLHGKGDDCNGWLRKTSIERYAQSHCLAVIMPTGEDSFFTDTVSGKLFFTCLSEELPQKMGRWFPISNQPEDTFVAGLSMGGYGALKLGLTYPERFGGVGAFTAVTMPDQVYEANWGPNDAEDREKMEKNLRNVFGEDRYQQKDLPMCLLDRCVKEKKKVPPIFLYEGRQDLLYGMNQKFYRKAKDYGLDITYEEWDGGHNWDFWDAAVKKVLDAFPLKNEAL